MKAYIVCTDSKATFCVSKADAASTRAEAVRQGVARKDIQTFDVGFGTAQKDLLRFLNMLTSQANVVDGVKVVAAHYALTRSD